jgi:hypothetical protein
MRRREFITLLSGVAVGWPLVARAERLPFVVGVIGNAPYWPDFREAMRDLGYSEGQNVKYEFRTDETEPARLAEAVRGHGWRAAAVGAAVVGGALAARNYGYGYGYPAYGYSTGYSYPAYGYGTSYSYPAYGYGYGPGIVGRGLYGAAWGRW